MKAYVIINEQHSLLESQEKILSSFFKDNWELFKVPAKGMTQEEIEDTIFEFKKENCTLVFVSPVPYMIKLAQDEASWNMAKKAFNNEEPFGILDVKIFHNDKREKKELPNGQVIFAIAKDGWKLI